MITALHKISPYSFITDDDINQFIIENKETIDKIRSMFHKAPKLLGEGADGVVFDIGGLVLKIFKNHFSFEAACEAMDRLYENPELAKTEAMIYDIDVLGHILGNEIYYYITEKMTTTDNFTRDQDKSLRDYYNL